MAIKKDCNKANQINLRNEFVQVKKNNGIKANQINDENIKTAE